MKKLLAALTAVLALSFAGVTFAEGGDAAAPADPSSQKSIPHVKKAKKAKKAKMTKAPAADTTATPNSSGK